MRAIWSSLLGLILTLGATYSAGADELIMQSIGNQPPNTAEGVLRPTKGMSMTQVEARFGAPANRVGPVGEPPISRWDYGQFTVYFEHQHVIHSVVHRGK